MSESDIKNELANATATEFAGSQDAPDPAFFPDPPPPPRDIAIIAAELLIRKAANAANLPKPIKSGSLVIVSVGSSSWISPAAKASPTSLLNVYHDEDAPRQRQSHLAVRKRDFSMFEKTERLQGRYDTKFVEEVSGDLRVGATCIVICTDPDPFVPPIMRQTADITLVMPPFDEAILLELVEQVTATRTSRACPDIRFDQIEPEHLRMAFRPHETADDYLDRLTRTFVEPAETPPKPVKIKLEDLHGMDEVVRWARLLAIDIAKFRAGTIIWAEVDPGALLIGPPGTGKTTAAAAIASFCELSFVPTSYATWQTSSDGHLGEVMKAMRSAFTEAREKSPALLFIDELDSVSSRGKQSGHREWWSSVINCLLEELDGVKSREGVVVVGATNHADQIDPAIRRAGRLDREIRIYLPSPDAIIGILRNYVGTALSAQELERAANLCAGRTGAEIEQVVRGAKRRARNEQRDMSYRDILAELGEGPFEQSPEQTLRTAVHEAGHAVAVMINSPGSPPTIAISPNGRRAGHALLSVDEGSALTPKAIQGILVTLLAGRAAEEVVFGEVSAGAGGSENSDLGLATKIASHAELSLGLGRSGVMWSRLAAPEELPTSLATRSGAEQAVSERLEEAYAMAKTLISKHRVELDALATILVERIVLSPAEVAEIFYGARSGQLKS